MIVSPSHGAQLTAGSHSVFGYAWGGEGTIVAVDVSLDGARRSRPRPSP